MDNFKRESIPVGCVPPACANRLCSNSHQISALVLGLGVGGGVIKSSMLSTMGMILVESE